MVNACSTWSCSWAETGLCGVVCGVRDDAHRLGCASTTAVRVRVLATVSEAKHGGDGRSPVCVLMLGRLLGYAARGVQW